MVNRRIEIRSLIVAAVLTVLAVVGVKAQNTADITQVAAEGARQVNRDAEAMPSEEQTVISVVTCYPGSRNYELYGHTMIRVQIKGQDLLFNYGIFNFRAKGFIYRFVKGDCDYMLAAYPSSYLTQGYEDRKIVEQVLNLTGEQKRKVIEFLWWNSMPENATYRYDWAYDNCATKPRDIIEQAVGESLRYGAPAEQHATFRSIMAYYDRNYPWQQFGIDLVLGMNLDRELTYREQMFSPIKLQQALADATIEQDGKRVPLVSATRNLVDGGDDGAALGPTPWLLRPATVFALLLLIVAAISYVELRRGKWLRWVDSLVFGAFALAGVLVAFLTFVSTHYGTSPNVNILWVHPLAFVPAVGVWFACMRSWLKVYHIANAAIIVALGLVWWLQPQVGNVAFVPMALLSLGRSCLYLWQLKRGVIAVSSPLQKKKVKA